MFAPIYIVSSKPCFGGALAFLGKGKDQRSKVKGQKLKVKGQKLK
jgi:hypothetical protein